MIYVRQYGEKKNIYRGKQFNSNILLYKGNVDKQKRRRYWLVGYVESTSYHLVTAVESIESSVEYTVIIMDTEEQFVDEEQRDWQILNRQKFGALTAYYWG